MNATHWELRMRARYLIFIVAMLLISCSSYAKMTGTVVDAETGEPIEGAVALVQWSAQEGIPGFTYWERFMVVEAVTDKDGKFSVSAPLIPFGKRRVVVIYKKGYLAWRNNYIFPDLIRREKLKWKRNQVFRLEHFTNKHSHSKHLSFINTALSLDVTSKLEQASLWEGKFARKERELYREKTRGKGAGDYTERDVWKEIVYELYGEGREVDDGVIRIKTLEIPKKLKEPGTRDINRGPGSGYPAGW